MSFTIQDEWWTFSIQFIKHKICCMIYHAWKSLQQGSPYLTERQCFAFSLTENLSWAGVSANCRHYDILSNRGEFIWEQTINWVQNFIVWHKSDLLYKAISLNNNKPRPAAKPLILDIQKIYVFFFFLNLLLLMNEEEHLVIFIMYRECKSTNWDSIEQFYV